MRREINISAALNVPGTFEKIKKVADRVARKGLSGGYQIYTIERQNGAVVETVLVIEGEPARYDGWTFVAMVEIENGGLIVSSAPLYSGGAYDRETFLRDSCEHCNRTVARRRYFIVEREGVRKQVGASCVKDFLGHDVTANYFADPLEEIEASYGGWTGFYLLPALAEAAHVISALGFRKSGEPASTRDQVNDLLANGHRAYLLRKEIGETTKADWAEADAAYAWAREMPGHSEYALNVRTIFDQENPALASANHKRLGLVASVLAAYRRHIADQQVKAERPSAPAPTGRVEVEGVVVSVKWQENDFGGGLKMLVEADAGYRVWASVPRDLTNMVATDSTGWQDVRDVKVGERVAFTATLTPSADDPAFAFAKRPTKARLLAA